MAAVPVDVLMDQVWGTVPVQVFMNGVEDAVTIQILMDQIGRPISCRVYARSPVRTRLSKALNTNGRELKAGAALR